MSAVSSAVAVLNAQNASNKKAAETESAALSKLWGSIVQRLPEIRNATNYYAHDVVRMSRKAVDKAVTSVSTAAGNFSGNSTLNSTTTQALQRVASVSSPPGSVAVKKSDCCDTETELHYLPSPASAAVGVSVKSVELQTLSNGKMFLLLVLAHYGHAVFEIRVDAVYEVFVNLCTSSESRLDDVVALRIVDSSSWNTLLVLHDHVLDKRDMTKPAGKHSTELPCHGASSICVIRENNLAAVSSKEFFQIVVLRVSDLVVVRTLQTDSNLTVAVSHSWLSYCALPDDTIRTNFCARKSETKLESVARNVSTLSRLLWGTTPSVTPQQQPASSVAIYDAISGEIIANFSPHNHSISAMAFSGDGTLLATASTSGTSVNIFQIMIGAVENRQSGNNTPTATVSLLARLSRGITQADICSISFSPLCRFVVVGTAIGTCHFFLLDNAIAKRGSAMLEGCEAEQVSAFARARSAPTASLVLPRTMFSSLCGEAFNDVMCAIVSQSCVVTCLKVTPRGILQHHSSYLDSFLAGTDGTKGHSLPVSESLDAFQWNFQAELETHHRYSPLDNFCFGEVDHHLGSKGSAEGWDECAELQFAPDDPSVEYTQYTSAAPAGDSSDYLDD